MYCTNCAKYTTTYMNLVSSIAPQTNLAAEYMECLRSTGPAGISEPGARVSGRDTSIAAPLVSPAPRGPALRRQPSGTQKNGSCRHGGGHSRQATINSRADGVEIEEAGFSGGAAKNRASECRETLPLVNIIPGHITLYYIVREGGGAGKGRRVMIGGGVVALLV